MAHVSWAKNSVMLKNLTTVGHPELSIEPPAKFAREMAQQLCILGPRGAHCTKGLLNTWMKQPEDPTKMLKASTTGLNTLMKTHNLRQRLLNNLTGST